jgi:hypothetical protein
MTSRRATLILLAVLALGGTFGLAVGAGMAWMAPERGPDLFDPRSLVQGLGTRTEARYQRDVETCRGLVARPDQTIGVLECLRRNGYVVNGRS